MPFPGTGNYIICNSITIIVRDLFHDKPFWQILTDSPKSGIMFRLSPMIHHHKLTVLFDYLGDRIWIDFVNELRYLFIKLTGSGTASRRATLIPVGLFYFLELKKNIYNHSECSLSP
jgi:hypothetical protein